MSRGLKIGFSVAFAVFVVLSVIGAVYADDDFEIPQQYDTIDFESDSDSEVQEIIADVTPEATPEADPETTPEATPEADPEATPEADPETTPEATISDLITSINHISDGLHADNIHLMLIICIGLGILLGFLIMTKIF